MGKTTSSAGGCLLSTVLFFTIWFPPPRTICRTEMKTVGRNDRRKGAVPAPLPLQYNSRRAYRQWYLQGESPALLDWIRPSIAPCNLPVLHITSCVKIRSHFHIDLFCFATVVLIRSSQLLCIRNNYLTYRHSDCGCPFHTSYLKCGFVLHRSHE